MYKPKNIYNLISDLFQSKAAVNPTVQIDEEYYLSLITEDYRDPIMSTFVCLYHKTDGMIAYWGFREYYNDCFKLFSGTTDAISDISNEIVECLIDETTIFLTDEYLKHQFCYVGSNKTKRFLKKKADDGDSRAALLRCALDIETKQRQINRYKEGSFYTRQIGNQMEDLCLELLDKASALGYNIGQIQDGADEKLPVVIIAELQTGTTVAYRCSRDRKWNNIPQYAGEWDGNISENASRIETCILEYYEDDISKRYDI